MQEMHPERDRTPCLLGSYSAAIDVLLEEPHPSERSRWCAGQAATTFLEAYGAGSSCASPDAPCLSIARYQECAEPRRLDGCPHNKTPHFCSLSVRRRTSVTGEPRDVIPRCLVQLQRPGPCSAVRSRFLICVASQTRTLSNDPPGVCNGARSSPSAARRCRWRVRALSAMSSSVLSFTPDASARPSTLATLATGLPLHLLFSACAEAPQLTRAGALHGKSGRVWQDSSDGVAGRLSPRFHEVLSEKLYFMVANSPGSRRPAAKCRCRLPADFRDNGRMMPDAGRSRLLIPSWIDAGFLT